MNRALKLYINFIGWSLLLAIVSIIITFGFFGGCSPLGDECRGQPFLQTALPTLILTIVGIANLPLGIALYINMQSSLGSIVIILAALLDLMWLYAMAYVLDKHVLKEEQR